MSEIKANKFEEGLSAYLSGKKPDRNPYLLHSKDWVRWNSGYQSGICGTVRKTTMRDFGVVAEDGEGNG